MKKYFLHDGVNQLGPFDIEELESKGISTETPVWFDTLTEWTPAGQIEELKLILVPTPPPFRNPTPLETPEKNKSIIYLWIAGAVFIGLVALLINETKSGQIVETNTSNTTKTETTVDSSVKEVEQKKLATIDPKKLALRKFDEYSPKIVASKDAAIGNSEAFVGDLNYDGLKDAIVYFVLTPKEGGNMIMGEGLAVYINQGDDMKAVAGFEPDYIFKVEEIKNNKIHIVKLEYAENDLPGEPSIETHKYLILNGNKLQESNTF